MLFCGLFKSFPYKTKYVHGTHSAWYTLLNERTGYPMDSRMVEVQKRELGLLGGDSTGDFGNDSLGFHCNLVINSIAAPTSLWED